MLLRLTVQCLPSNRGSTYISKNKTLANWSMQREKNTHNLKLSFSFIYLLLRNAILVNLNNFVYSKYEKTQFFSQVDWGSLNCRPRSFDKSGCSLLKKKKNGTNVCDRTPPVRQCELPTVPTGTYYYVCIV